MMIDTQSLELTKAKKFTGTPSLHGDRFLACHGLFLGALSEGKSTLQNVPNSDWNSEVVQILQYLGYQIHEIEDSVEIEGNYSEPSLINNPLVPHHEIVLMILGGIFAGFKSTHQIKIQFNQVSKKALQIFKKLFDCETISTTHENSNFEIIQVKGINHLSLKGFSREEYLAKTGILYYHIVAKTHSDLNCFNSGPNHLENLLPHFCDEINIVSSGAGEMSEFEKRMARKLKSFQKPEVKVIIPDSVKLKGANFNCPNDISLASVYALAATLIPGAEIELKNVVLNPSRAKFITALRRMDASIEILRKKDSQGETFGDIKVKHAPLKGRKFDFESLSGMIDEIPLLIIATAFAEGKSVIRDMEYLRTYEVDFLKQIISSLKGIQVEIGELEDGLVIQGREDYDGQTFNTMNNAMLGFAYLVLGLKSHGTTLIENTECMEQLFPGAIENLCLMATASTAV